MEKNLYKESRPVHPLGCFIAYYLFLIPFIALFLFYIIFSTAHYITKNLYFIIAIFIIIKIIDFEITSYMIYKKKINKFKPLES